MKGKEQKYDKLISRIKAARPELDNSQTLTSEIMSAVEKLSNQPKANIPLQIVSWASSVAAVLLLGVFLSEYSIPSVSSTQQMNISSYRPYSLAEISIENDNTSDKINNVVRKKREIKKERESILHLLSTNIKTFK